MVRAGLGPREVVIVLLSPDITTHIMKGLDYAEYLSQPLCHVNTGIYLHEIPVIEEPFQGSNCAYGT